MGGDLDSWIASIRKCELLPEHDLKHLCEYVQELMLEESTVPVSTAPPDLPCTQPKRSHEFCLAPADAHLHDSNH